MYLWNVKKNLVINHPFIHPSFQGRRMKMSYSRFLVFSHAGGGTKLHKDAWGSGFWNTCVYGQKRWLFIRHFTGRAREVAVDEKWFEVRFTS